MGKTTQDSTTVEMPIDKLPEGFKLNYETVIKPVPVLDPDYGKTWVPHNRDAEYVLVGLLGQVPIRKDQPVDSRWVYIRELSSKADLWLVK